MAEEKEESLRKKTYGLNLFIHQLGVRVNHHELKQCLGLAFTEIHFQLGKNIAKKTGLLSVRDVFLGYQNYK